MDQPYNKINIAGGAGEGDGGGGGGGGGGGPVALNKNQKVFSLRFDVIWLSLLRLS